MINKLCSLALASVLLLLVNKRKGRGQNVGVVERVRMSVAVAGTIEGLFAGHLVNYT